MRSVCLYLDTTRGCTELCAAGRGHRRDNPRNSLPTSLRSAVVSTVKHVDCAPRTASGQASSHSNIFVGNGFGARQKERECSAVGNGSGRNEGVM